jgi:hypothetical protein
MVTAVEFTPEDLGACVLRSQYNDLIRRRSLGFNGERRLQWAVLKSAIRDYLTNRRCSNSAQRKRFEEVRSWFESGTAEAQGLFGFRTLCEVLGIDSHLLLNTLRSLDIHTLRTVSRLVAGGTRARKSHAKGLSASAD